MFFNSNKSSTLFRATLCNYNNISKRATGNKMATCLKPLLQRLITKLKDKYSVIRNGKKNIFATQFRLSIGYFALEGCRIHPTLVLGLFALTLLAGIHHIINLLPLFSRLTPFDWVPSPLQIPF